MGGTLEGKTGDRERFSAVDDPALRSPPPGASWTREYLEKITAAGAIVII